MPDRLNLENLAFLRYVLKHDPNAIAVLDRDLRYIAVSDRFLHDYEVKEEDIIGRRHYDVFPEMPQVWKEVHQRCLAGAIERSEDDCFVRSDGTITYNSWECRPWHTDDGQIGGIIMYTEVTTERKLAEMALRASEEKYRRLHESMTEAYGRVDLNGRFVETNSAFESLVGYTGEELKRLTYKDLTPEKWHAIEDQIFNEQIMVRGFSDVYEKEYRRKDGTVFPVEIRTFLLTNGESRPLNMWAIVRDITARKRIEEARVFLSECGYLHPGDDFFISLARYLAETLDVEFVCVDRLLPGETAAQTVATYYRGEFRSPVTYSLKNTPCVEVVRKNFFYVPNNVSTLFPQDQMLREIHAESYCGSTLWGYDGQPIGLIVIMSTKTIPNVRLAEHLLNLVGVRAAGELERRQADQALQALNQELEQRVSERTALAEHRANQLRTLAFQLAHTEQRERERIGRLLHDDLQQTLIAAKYQMGALKVRSPEPKNQQTIALVDEYLNSALDTSRSLTTELYPAVLNEAGLGPALAWLAQDMKTKYGLDVQADIQAEVNKDEEGVAFLMFEAARELLLNTVKHSDATSARVSLSKTRGNEVQIVVKDNGRGFDARKLSADVRAQSSGLGLMAIRERMDYIGGLLEIATAPGAGAEVTLVARIAEPPSRLHAREPWQAGSKPREEVNGKRTRVLLVDDHLLVRQGIKEMIARQSDMEVVGEAANGHQAIEMAHQYQPDVIVMDMSMPGMNGIEATREIAHERPEIRIIGLSMYDQIEYGEAMLAAGAVDYVTKDGPLEDLMTAIRRCGSTPIGQPVLAG